MSFPEPSISSKRVRKYLDAIDRNGGKAIRMDFYRIAGSEANLDRWINFLKDRRVIRDDVRGGRKAYSKTGFGEDLHEILKNKDAIVGILTQELSGRRLRRMR